MKIITILGGLRTKGNLLKYSRCLKITSGKTMKLNGSTSPGIRWVAAIGDEGSELAANLAKAITG